MREASYKVALVIVLSTIITQETHRIILGDMLRVIFHELLHAVPERRDSINVFVQTQDEAVFLIVVLHKTEWVKCDVAKQLNARFHAPVKFVVHHQGMAEKEARFITTHVPIALRVSVDNLALSHIPSRFFGFLLVNPIRIRPVLLRDETIVRGPRNKRGGDFLEGRIEWLVVQEDPIVVEIVVEAVFDLSD